MCCVSLFERAGSFVGASRGLTGLFIFGCISASKCENAGSAEVENSDKDFAADTSFLRVGLEHFSALDSR